MRHVSLLLAGALLAGGTIASAARPLDPEAQIAKALAGRVAGEPVDCLNLRDIQSSQIIDRTAILYTANGRIYLNRPRVGATSLGVDDVLVTDTHSSQLCSIDTVHLVDRGSRFPSGFVGLGKFVPYARADARR